MKLDTYPASNHDNYNEFIILLVEHHS